MIEGSLAPWLNKYLKGFSKDRPHHSYLFWRGRSGWIRICDIMILSLVPAHVMGRLGCYLHGCCYGVA